MIALSVIAALALGAAPSAAAGRLAAASGAPAPIAVASPSTAAAPAPVAAAGRPAAAAAPAPARFVWPRPALVEVLDVPDVIQADGVPVRLHLIRSRLGVQELLQTYATAFDRAGFYVALKQQRLVAEPHLTALDVRTKISYSAVFSPHPDGTTSCLLGEAALGKRRAPDSQADFAPLMVNARGVVRVDQETGRMISFSARSTPGEVDRFYRQALPAVGFAAEPVEEGTGLYRRGQERVRVLARANPNGTTGVLLIQLSADR